MKQLTKDEFAGLCKKYIILYREDPDDNKRELRKIEKKITKGANNFGMMPDAVLYHVIKFAESGEPFDE